MAESSGKPKKWQRVLRWFTEGGSLNRFEAVRSVRDYCLNSSISGLEARGVKILRREETVPGPEGVKVHCLRYRLDPDSAEKAKQLLGGAA